MLIACTAVVAQRPVNLAAQGAGCMYTVNNKYHVYTNICDHCVQEIDRLSQQMQRLFVQAMLSDAYKIRAWQLEQSKTSNALKVRVQHHFPSPLKINVML